MSIISHLKNLFSKKPKLLVICGPTATGKTEKSIKLAREQNGEVISADSRQVYRGLDIGTAKIRKSEMSGVPHHMIDIADPDEIYTVAQYKTAVQKIISDIHMRGKLPILVGGTGMYIDAVIYNRDFPAVSPNLELRKELEELSLTELQNKLKELDSERYESIDQKNPVRLIRAIEIANELNTPHHVVIPMKMGIQNIITKFLDSCFHRNDKVGRNDKICRRDKQGVSPYKTEIIYLDLPDNELKQKINIRNTFRLENGLIEEVEGLHNDGLSWERMHQLGLEYRYVSQFLQGEIESKKELLEILNTKTWQFVKRQRTWFKKYLKK